MWLENKSIEPIKILPAKDNHVDICLTIALKDGKDTLKTGVNEQ
jgi:hypothetical protein